jgi:hypothetical protein
MSRYLSREQRIQTADQVMRCAALPGHIEPRAIAMRIPPTAPMISPVLWRWRFMLTRTSAAGGVSPVWDSMSATTSRSIRSETGNRANHAPIASATTPITRANAEKLDNADASLPYWRRLRLRLPRIRRSSARCRRRPRIMSRIASIIASNTIARSRARVLLLRWSSPPAAG